MTTVKLSEKPSLKDPILLEGLPGVGNIGRVVVGYLVKELGSKKFAELYSEHFFPFVIVQDENKIKLMKNEFYYWQAKKKGQRDLILVTGDCQALSPNGHYEVNEKIIDVAEQFKVKEIITVGGLATGEMEEKPKVLGAVTDGAILKKYKGHSIEFTAGEKVGYIVGAAGLLLGLGKERGIDGLCMLGETSGFPIVTDPKAAEAVLKCLSSLLNIQVDMRSLHEKVKEMDKFIKRVEALQRKAIMEIAKEEKAPVTEKEQMRYIG